MFCETVVEANATAGCTTRLQDVIAGAEVLDVRVVWFAVIEGQADGDEVFGANELLVVELLRELVAEVVRPDDELDEVGGMLENVVEVPQYVTAQLGSSMQTPSVVSLSLATSEGGFEPSSDCEPSPGLSHVGTTGLPVAGSMHLSLPCTTLSHCPAQCHGTLRPDFGSTSGVPSSRSRYRRASAKTVVPLLSQTCSGSYKRIALPRPVRFICSSVSSSRALSQAS